MNDSLVKERVYGGYLETVFAGSLNSRPISTVVGVRVERTQADISGLATNFVALTRLANDATQYGVSNCRHRHGVELDQLHRHPAQPVIQVEFE